MIATLERDGLDAAFLQLHVNLHMIQTKSELPDSSIRL